MVNSDVSDLPSTHEVKNVSPVPPMSPETEKILHVLQGDYMFDSDDSVKDPNYEADEDETDCSDFEVRQRSFQIITVEAEISAVSENNQTKENVKPQEQNQSKPRIIEQQDDLDRIEIDNNVDNEVRAELETGVENDIEATRCMNDMGNDKTNTKEGIPKRGRKRKGIFSRKESKD